MRLGPQNVPEDGREANSSQQKSKAGRIEPNQLEPVISQERVPAVHRLGPQQSLERINTGQAEPKAKRKPGRPAGRANVQEIPLKLTGSNLRKRKVSQPKPTTGRHKTGTTTANQSAKAGARKKTKNGSPGSSLLPNGSNQSSDNQPIARMIPPRSKRKMDFHNPSTLDP